MVPAIADFVSGAFYEGRLRTAPSTIPRLRPISWPMDPTAGSMVVVDTSSIGRTIDKAYGGHAVVEHASIVADIVRQVSGHPNQQASGSILILSAYRAQTHLIRSLLERNVPPSTGSSLAQAVSTIHAAQGDEADVVVLTIDDDPAKPVFLGSADGKRLLNVALSRARRGLVIVGEISRLSQSTHVAVATRQVLLSLANHSFALPPLKVALAI